MLRYENGITKLLVIALLGILSAYYFDLYSPQNLPSKNETYFRLLMLFGTLSFILSVAEYVIPGVSVGRGVFTLGMILAVFSVLCWRGLYVWLLTKPFLREQVVVLGSGQKAAQFVEAIRTRTDLGIDIVGWTGASNSLETSEALTAAVHNLIERQIPRVVVAVKRSPRHIARARTPGTPPEGNPHRRFLDSPREDYGKDQHRRSTTKFDDFLRGIQDQRGRAVCQKNSLNPRIRRNTALPGAYSAVGHYRDKTHFSGADLLLADSSRAQRQKLQAI